ncbi:hypothetical protein [Paraglaciecola sp. 20A4]|uniref:hypothetical protein n=1 Tax=Paraglaciecola sp. 20A4 TaxID=2687288 RepID=UPI0014074A73|nr:hypothetical protein [Paraglaciecola sp. 20A4]
MLTIYFLHGTTDELGREQSQGISEVLFPDVNYVQNKHAITITKMFVGQQCHRWEVKSVDHPAVNEVKIGLIRRIPSQPEIYLSQTHKVKRNVISLLRKGTLVEVDYGYIPSVKKCSGDTKSNKRYPDVRQSGEMHKRRLAIVVKASGTRVQVVPISSNEPPIGDRACFEMARSSLEKLMHYNDQKKRSFAVCSMIETVALTRILPPLAKPVREAGRQAPQRSDGYPHKVSNIDIQALDKALSVTVGIGDYKEIKLKNTELYLSNSALKKRLVSLQEQLDANKASLDVAQTKVSTHDALWNMLEDHYRQLHSTKSHEEVSDIIKDELKVWIEIAEDA